jgi:hypothetical protein
MRFRWLLVFPAFAAASLMAQDGTGLKISAAVDLVGTFKADKDSTADDAFNPREAEILLSAPVDQTFNGQLSFAAHREGGAAMAELHEAFISSSKLIPRSNIRVGQFFLGVGRFNRFHRHEWPVIFAPKVHEEFFGKEGALDSGIEYSFLAPLPFYLETTIGVTNGFTYGHSHKEGEKPKKPTHYGRVASYLELPGNGGAQAALNYLSRTDAEEREMTLTGLDFTAKWRDAGLLNFFVQSEVWHRTLKPKDAKADESIGAYILPQYAADSQWFLGLMVEYFSVTSLKDAIGNAIDNSNIAYVPTITYKASEFSSLRLAYDRSTYHREDQSDKTEQKVEVQATFIIGAHPAHDF